MIASELTRAQRDLLSVLAFRAPFGPCYLVLGRWKRWALVVPEMAPARLRARIRAYQAGTVGALEELIVLGPLMLIPEYFSRREGDGVEGYRVELTLVGWGVLGKEPPVDEYRVEMTK